MYVNENIEQVNHEWNDLKQTKFGSSPIQIIVLIRQRVGFFRLYELFDRVDWLEKKLNGG